MWSSASLASPFLNTLTLSSDSLCSLRFLGLSSGSPHLSLCLSLSFALSLSLGFVYSVFYVSLYVSLYLSSCLSISLSWFPCVCLSLPLSLISNLFSMRRRTLFFSAPVFQRAVGSLVLDLGHPRLQAPVFLVLRTGKPPLPS